MNIRPFRVIDPVATGANILRLRKERGLTVRDLQAYFGFEEPQAIYKWQRGQSLPSVDNLYALGALLDVTMDEILVQANPEWNMLRCGQQAESACCPPHFATLRPRPETERNRRPAKPICRALRLRSGAGRTAGGERRTFQPVRRQLSCVKWRCEKVCAELEKTTGRERLIAERRAMRGADLDMLCFFFSVDFHAALQFVCT